MEKKYFSRVPFQTLASSFQVQGKQQPPAATGNSSDQATDQLIPALSPQGLDVLKAIAGMMGMLLGNGTLVLGPDGQVQIQASCTHFETFTYVVNIWKFR